MKNPTKNLNLKTKLKAAWLRVDAHYEATPKVDKIIIGSAMVLAMGSVAWAATVTNTDSSSGAGSTQVQVMEIGGGLAMKAKGTLSYGQGNAKFPHPRDQQRAILNGRSTDCSSWANFVDTETKAAINKLTGNKLSNFGADASTVTIIQSLIGKGGMVWFKSKQGAPSGPLPELKPGMVILFGKPGNHAVNYAGGSRTVGHVGIVVRINGTTHISEVSLRSPNGSITSNASGVLITPDIKAFAKRRLDVGSGYDVFVGDPLKSVRTLIGDTATVTLDGNLVASGESPGQGELGGKKGLFGQPVEDDTGVVGDSEYMALDGGTESGSMGISGALHELVMGRAASSAWHRGITLASEPRLLAELAYMKTIQNIMLQARSASIQRREAMMAATLSNSSDSTLSTDAAKQRAIVTEGGGN